MLERTFCTLDEMLSSTEQSQKQRTAKWWYVSMNTVALKIDDMDDSDAAFYEILHHSTHWIQDIFYMPVGSLRYVYRILKRMNVRIIEPEDQIEFCDRFDKSKLF